MSGTSTSVGHDDSSALNPRPSAGATPVVRTLLLCDLVESTRMVAQLGDSSGAALLAQHDQMARELMRRFSGREIDKSDGFLVLFERPIQAVRFALAYQDGLAELADAQATRLACRVGIHLGEVVLRENDGQQIAHGAKPLEVEGLAKAIAARVMSLGDDGRVLLTRSAFDLARRGSVGVDSADSALRWVAHGRYRLGGIDEPMEVFEVAPLGPEPILPPRSSEKAQRVDDQDTIIGWRPAPGVEVPGRPNWLLLRKLGEGGFGESWLGEQRLTHEPRVFKFCYDARSVRGLRREITIFRLLKETLGDRRDITRLLDWNLDDAPYFIESEYSSGGSLIDWAQEQGGIASVSLETRLELAAQVAEALAAAHSVGVLHKDIKPANVLIVRGQGGAPRAQLADFGIGLVVDRSKLSDAGITFRNELADSDAGGGTSGTLGYLAPELVEGKPPTLQADIYALGVLLYQLVIGDFSHVMAPGWERGIEDELLREDIAAMVDGSPERRLGDALRVAERLRSLEPRRAERADAARAAREAAETKVALERSRRRRKLTVGIAAASVVFASISAYQAYRTTQEAERANREAKTAQSVSDFLVKLFEVSDPSEARGNSVTAREILDRGAERVQKDLGAEPRVLMSLLGVMGRVYANLGLYERAVAMSERALAIGQRTSSPDDPRVVQAKHDLANAYWYVGRFADAEPLYREVVAFRSAKFGASAPQTLLAQADLASLYMRESRWQEAEQAALAVLANAGSNISLFEARDIARNTLINTYAITGRLEEAERIARDTFQEQLTRLGDDHPDTLMSEHTLAAILVGAGKLVDAEQLLRKALAGEERVLGEAHEKTARTRGWLACVLLKSGQRAAALALERENLEHGQLVPASSPSCIFMNTDPDFLQLVEDNAHPRSQ